MSAARERRRTDQPGGEQAVDGTLTASGSVPRNPSGASRLEGAWLPARGGNPGGSRCGAGSGCLAVGHGLTAGVAGINRRELDATMKNGRFFVGLVGVAAVVAWLMWTGNQRDSMVYYLTPVELMARVDGGSDLPSEAGVKVSGRVVEGIVGAGCGRHRSSPQVHRGRRPGRVPEVLFTVVYEDASSPTPSTTRPKWCLRAATATDGVFRRTHRPHQVRQPL